MSLTYKFTEFVDLLLVRLYELDRVDSGRLFNLDQIALEIRGNVPAAWTFDAAKVLDSRSLAHCIFYFGGTEAKISGEGRLYVEEGRGITKKIQEMPSSYFVTVTGNNNQVATGTTLQNVNQTMNGEIERSSAFRILEEIKTTVAQDDALPGPKKIEADTYTGLIEQELKKPDPNKLLIGAVLDPLGKIASIAGNVAALARLFAS